MLLSHEEMEGRKCAVSLSQRPAAFHTNTSMVVLSNAVACSNVQVFTVIWCHWENSFQVLNGKLNYTIILAVIKDD